MSAARGLAALGNQNTLAVETGSAEVGIASTAPSSTLDVRGEVKVGTNIQLGSAGVITASSYSGSFPIVDASSLAVSGISTLVRLAVTDEVVTGIITALGLSGNLTGAAATISGALNVDGTTDSTSVSTGALIVDGGLGVAKNVYIGAGLSVAGTLTYEDVTNVDSVGVVTAKSGVNVSGGELNVGLGFSVGNVGVATALGVDVKSNLTVGSGITMGSAGVATFSGTSDVHLHDNVRLNIGDASDLAIYHNGSNSFIQDTGTGSLFIDGTIVYLRNTAGDEHLANFHSDGAANLYYNGSLTFSTTDDGTTTTGICSATDFSGLSGGAADFPNGITATSVDTTANIDINADSNLRIGANQNFQLKYTGSEAQLVQMDNSNPMRIKVRDGAETAALFNPSGSVDLYYDDSAKLFTTYDGVKITGFTSTTAGMGVTGGLFEGAWIKAGKLSDNKTLGISTANVFYFTTQESTTATPDIRWNDSYTLSSKMAVGDVASVTVITTAAAGGYSANWTIDGTAVSEEWVGGSAPSGGGSDGLDIYSLTIIKTGTGTGNGGFKVIANLTNAT